MWPGRTINVGHPGRRRTRDCAAGVLGHWLTGRLCRQPDNCGSRSVGLASCCGWSLLLVAVAGRGCGLSRPAAVAGRGVGRRGKLLRPAAVAGCRSRLASRLSLPVAGPAVMARCCSWLLSVAAVPGRHSRSPLLATVAGCHGRWRLPPVAAASCCCGCCRAAELAATAKGWSWRLLQSPLCQALPLGAVVGVHVLSAASLSLNANQAPAVVGDTPTSRYHLPCCVPSAAVFGRQLQRCVTRVMRSR